MPACGASGGTRGNLSTGRLAGHLNEIKKKPAAECSGETLNLGEKGRGDAHDQSLSGACQDRNMQGIAKNRYIRSDRLKHNACA